MKLIQTTTLLIVLSISVSIHAQDNPKEKQSKPDKTTYYKTRAIEDAKFEQSYKAENKTEAELFWESQEAYENNLKKRDKKAYKAYMKGKQEAYAEHYKHCDQHCHHSNHYYHRATMYYYGYHDHYYYHSPRRRTLSTKINLGSSGLRLGVF
ncbi:hypothetical protein [Aestuariibaculum sediminum]|uniref:Uncharacterized protein n=1 Tax=Aestuariibaculum sediminum TaxID=2770637 RepID=A0A8J6Q825_9FLAO|nr:hypothetical protein [Aestuariibaculum sediminum]MBD0832265.1 hypothetical protein [Aestuariibaculum sediminum]